MEKYPILSTPQKMLWVRSAEDKVIAGVCGGLGKSFDINPWILRLLWLAAVLMLGAGVLIYLIFAWTLPRSDRLNEAYQNRWLGVCARLAQKSEIEVGVIRAITVLIAIGSLGTTMLVYVILNFALGKNKTETLASS